MLRPWCDLGSCCDSECPPQSLCCFAILDRLFVQVAEGRAVFLF